MWIVRGLGADFHFDETAAVFVNSARELLAKHVVGTGGEAAAAVDCDGVPHLAAVEWVMVCHSPSSHIQFHVSLS